MCDSKVYYEETVTVRNQQNNVTLSRPAKVCRNHDKSIVTIYMLITNHSLVASS